MKYAQMFVKSQHDNINQVIWNAFQELCMSCILLRFIVAWYFFILPISFKDTSLALRQPYDGPNASEANPEYYEEINHMNPPKLW